MSLPSVMSVAWALVRHRTQHRPFSRAILAQALRDAWARRRQQLRQAAEFFARGVMQGMAGLERVVAPDVSGLRTTDERISVWSGSVAGQVATLTEAARLRLLGARQ